MLRSHRFGAMIKSGLSLRSSLTLCACTGVVAHCTLTFLNLNWFFCFRFYKEYEICLREEIYCGICVRKTIKIYIGMIKSLQKQNGAVFFTHVGIVIMLKMIIITALIYCASMGECGRLPVYIRRRVIPVVVVVFA